MKSIHANMAMVTHGNNSIHGNIELVSMATSVHGNIVMVTHDNNNAHAITAVVSMTTKVSKIKRKL